MDFSGAKWRTEHLCLMRVHVEVVCSDVVQQDFEVVMSLWCVLLATMYDNVHSHLLTTSMTLQTPHANAQTNRANIAVLEQSEQGRCCKHNHCRHAKCSW